MKPHEETWTVDDVLVLLEGPTSVRRQRDRLGAAAPAMARALLAHVDACGPCRGSGTAVFRSIGPVPCEVCAVDRAALKEAGVLE